jgi:hypothetical protein
MQDVTKKAANTNECVNALNRINPLFKKSTWFKSDAFFLFFKSISVACAPML